MARLIRENPRDLDPVWYISVMYTMLKPVHYLVTLSVLLDYGLLINDSKAYFYTPLDIAVIRRAENVIRYLILSGADVNRDSFALRYAAQQRLLGILKILLEAGAVIDIDSILSESKAIGHKRVVSIINKFKK